jgi:leucyl-tRNA synthetase
MLHSRGLAYQAESLVNYDPIDQTVLANEQVDEKGCSWRSGAKVEKLMLKQWFLKIKDYQEPLLADLDALAQNGNWPEKVLNMQRNWIGKSEGSKILFGLQSTTTEQSASVEVFTTRADTLFGVQYIALSLNHPLVQQEAIADASLQAFIERAKDLPADTKEGYLLSNLEAQNPIAKLDLDIDPSLPVYVAPYVLDDYGSGAVMGVPGHDTRDHAFWRANAGTAPIKVVITTEPGTSHSPLVAGSDQDRPMTERGFISADIKQFQNLPSDEAAQEIIAKLHNIGKSAETTQNWRLRDWLISRQRYWGTPIPIIHCRSCGPVPVPEQDLPVKLPNLPDSFFDGRKGNPLAEDETWKKTKCPKCGSAAERETDTMDTFMDSSWYFFRFLDPKNETALVDPQKANAGMPVDLYIGGVEHAILHLLYARFISKFLASTSTWPHGKLNNGEPFERLITQGMVHGETFTDPENGRFLRPDELDMTTPSKPRVKATGLVPNVSYEKMSKSKYNGVDPTATITNYGADATRAHMLFQAPVGDVLEWDPKKITGVQRWLTRVIKLSSAFWIPTDELARFDIPENADTKLVDILSHLCERGVLTTAESSSEASEKQLLDLLAQADNELWIKTQRIIANVHESYSQTCSLNTIVSDLMTLTNTIYDTPHSSAATPYLKWYSLAQLIRMVAPIAPGVAEEAWHMLTGVSDSRTTCNEISKYPPTVFAAGVPVADLEIIPHLSRTIKCVVQVNGKRKFEVNLEKDFDTHEVADQNTMSQWVLSALLQTSEGKDWLDQDTGKIWKLSDTKQPHSLHKFVPEGWQVIIVNQGRLCNIVSPKKPKKIKGETDPAADNTGSLATVSADMNREQKIATLNINSAEKSAPMVGNGIMEESRTANLAALKEEETKQPSEPHPESCPESCPESHPEQQQKSSIGDQITQAEPGNITNQVIASPNKPRLSTLSMIGRLTVQEVHARVDELVESLPIYLRPCYVPPKVYPVTRASIHAALQHSGSWRKKDIVQYEKDFASFTVPSTIAPKYILSAYPEDMTSWKREQVVMYYNAIFPDQITLLSHLDPTPSRSRTILAAQRHSILHKLLLHRDALRISHKMPSTMEEQLKTTQSMTAEQSPSVKHGARRKLKLNRNFEVRRVASRVRDVWGEIISLWAGRDGEKLIAPEVEVVAKQEDGPENRVFFMGPTPKSGREEYGGITEDLGEEHWTSLAGNDSRPVVRGPNAKPEEAEDGVESEGDWLWLAKDDSNRKWRHVERPGPVKSWRPPRWG